LLERETDSFAIGIIQLILSSESQAAIKARQLGEKIEQERDTEIQEQVKHRLIYRLLGLGCFLYLEIMALNQLKALLTILPIIYPLCYLCLLKVSLAIS
ncbi:MAG: hypothetical protein ACK56I_03345, partial [bacterium]